MSERSGSAISHSFTSMVRLSSPFEIDLSNIPSSSGSVCTTWTHLHVLRTLMTCGCLSSLTPWPTITSICKSFGGKKNQSSCSKAGGRGIACTIFALCSRAIFLSSWLLFGKKRVIFTSGNLANWMANSLFMVESPITWSPCRCQNSDFYFARSMHSVIQDFLSLRLILLVSCRQ